MIDEKVNFDDFIEKSQFDLTNKLPECARVQIRIKTLGKNGFTVKTQIKGLGKTIIAKETGEDCYGAIRTSKRKALSMAQNLLRKKRGRWRTTSTTPSLADVAS